MNTKTVLLVAIVAVVVIGAGAYFVLSDDGEDSKDVPTTEKGRCVIFGNTNNDDYLNQEDLTLLKQIVADGVWDYKLYPYADANHDGAVDQKDVDYLDNILNKKNPTKMYYVGMKGGVYDIAYPTSGNIAVNAYYGFYNAMAAGIYDRVTAGTNVCIEFDENMYPGCSKMDVVGTKSSYDPELIMKHNVKYTLGYYSDKEYEMLKPVGCDMIMFNITGQKTHGNVMSSAITLGTMFDQIDDVDKFKNYFDGLLADIAEKAKQIPRPYTYVMPYCPGSEVENKYDTIKRSDNTMMGDVYAMSLLPMEDLIWSADTGFPSIQTEEVMRLDPDFIIISNADRLQATDDPAVVEKQFRDWAANFSMTNAYKNKQVIGISYDAVGCAYGIGCLPLVASYLWPDIFDEQEGWEIFEETLKMFTKVKFDDIHDLGGLIPYKL